MGEGQHALVLTLKSGPQGGEYCFGARRDVRPWDGRLDRIERISSLPQAVAQVRRPKTRAPPHFADRTSGREAAQRQPSQATAGGAKNEQAGTAAVAECRQTALPPPPHRRPARQLERRLGFDGVAQSQHRGRQTALDGAANRLQAFVPAVEEDSAESFDGREPADADHGPPDDPQPPLRSERHLTKIRPGGAGWKRWEL